MLVIRDIQFKAFAKEQERLFIERMINYAREKYTDLCEPFSDESLRVLMKQCIKRTKKYELLSEIQIIEFLELMLTFGIDFDSNPQFQHISKILQPEQNSQRSILFRFAEVKKKLYQLAKKQPDIIITQLDIPTDT